jgi:hypothetical protein
MRNRFPQLFRVFIRPVSNEEERRSRVERSEA